MAVVEQGAAAGTSPALDYETLKWVAQFAEIERVAQISNLPWSRVYAITKGETRVFLKVVPGERANLVQLVQALSQRFGDLVPQVLGCAPERGLLLMRDHGGQVLGQISGPSKRIDVLTPYAEIQRRSHHEEELLRLVPTLDLTSLYPHFLRFLQDPSERPEQRVGLGYYLGAEAAERMAQLFTELKPLFVWLLADAERLPVTINHCDLRGGNLAERPDGKLVIYDWDEAVRGPVGMSLRTVFVTAFRPYVVLNRLALLQDPETFKGDRIALNRYIGSLQEDPAFVPATLVEGLPGAILAGLLRFIESFADYARPDTKFRETVGRVQRAKLDDLMMICEAAATLDRSWQAPLAKAFSAAGEGARAQRLLAGIRPRPIVRKGAKVDQHLWEAAAELPEGFPTVVVGPEEQARQAFEPKDLKVAARLFVHYGAILIENAFPPSLLGSCRDALAQLVEGGEYSLEVGDKRRMHSLPFSGPFAEAALLASPFVRPLLNVLLGRDHILGSLTAVTSEAGAEEQRLHRDHPWLYGELNDQPSPPFAVTMLVPVCDVSEVMGTTRIVKGSHRLREGEAVSLPRQQRAFPLGSCLLMNYCLDHQGMANQSETARPLLSYVYQRFWFQDRVNFKKQPRLKLNRSDVETIPAGLLRLVSWALEPDGRGRA